MEEGLINGEKRHGQLPRHGVTRRLSFARRLSSGKAIVFSEIMMRSSIAIYFDGPFRPTVLRSPESGRLELSCFDSRSLLGPE